MANLEQNWWDYTWSSECITNFFLEIYMWWNFNCLYRIVFFRGAFASVRYNLTSLLATGEAACGGDALHATPHPFFKSSPPQPATTSDGFFAQEPSRLRWRYAATHILLSLTNGLGCPRSPSLVFLYVSRFRRTQRKKYRSLLLDACEGRIGMESLMWKYAGGKGRMRDTNFFIGGWQSRFISFFWSCLDSKFNNIARSEF